ncbi:MAG: hypothetical protein WC809_21520 [Sinimarinibacterium sp.]|jgi:hypothetical protein
MKLRIVALLGAIAAAAALSSPAFAGSLDGQIFTGQMTPKGETKGDPDDFEFKDGKFHSTACDKYGFDSSAYTATESGKSVLFAATTHSGESTITWKGEAAGGRVSGTAVLSEKGKTTEYVFAGDLKK